MTDQKTQHGGKREGAGREAGPDGLKDRRTIRISERMWKYMLAQEGGATAYIERLVKADMESKPSSPP